MKTKLNWRAGNKVKTIYQAYWFVILCRVHENGSGIWSFSILGTESVYAGHNFDTKELAMEACEQEILKACAEFMAQKWGR